MSVVTLGHTRGGRDGAGWAGRGEAIVYDEHFEKFTSERNNLGTTSAAHSHTSQPSVLLYGLTLLCVGTLQLLRSTVSPRLPWRKIEQKRSGGCICHFLSSRFMLLHFILCHLTAPSATRCAHFVKATHELYHDSSFRLLQWLV